MRLRPAILTTTKTVAPKFNHGNHDNNNNNGNHDHHKSNHKDDCEDRSFNKYMKKGEKPFQRYLDKAGDVPLPHSKKGYNKYFDKIDNYAQDYLHELDPHAKKYVDDLGDCLH